VGVSDKPFERLLCPTVSIVNKCLVVRVTTAVTLRYFEVQ
jgi:hypothetical protein